MISIVGDFLKSGANLLIFMVALPALSGLLLWLLRKKYILQLATALLSSSLNLIFALSLYSHGEFRVELPYISLGFELSLRVYALSSIFIVIAAAALLILSLFSVMKLKSTHYGGLLSLCLFLSFAVVNGAMLSESLGLLLFFAEGLLCTLGGMLLIGNTLNPKTAVKALTITGLADLVMMLGIIITEHSAGTGSMSEIEKLPLSGICLLGFVCIAIGALGLCGCMPFHSWIPDAADDASAVFMAAFPAAIQKIVGIYILSRAVLDIFDFRQGSAESFILISFGALTFALASLKALLQSNMKCLLSYLSIAQTGYMVMSIGAGTETGLIGVMFLMLNSILFMAGLFMLCSCMEKEASSQQLPASGKKITVEKACFTVLALSAAGFPGTNGFFPYVLINRIAYDENPLIFTLALLALFLMALSLLKFGHCVFSTKAPDVNIQTQKSNLGSLIPACIISILCILFGLYASLPLNGFIGKAFATSFKLSQLFEKPVVAVITVLILIIAACCFIYGYKIGHLGNESTHRAVKFNPDPYKLLMSAMAGYSVICMWLERGVSWIYDKGVPGIVTAAASALHRFDNGRLSRYLNLAVFGVLMITIIFVIILK